MNVTLPIGHLLLLKVSYNLVPFIRNLQRSINFLLTCPKFICHVLDTSTLLHFCHILHHMSSFWNYFDFIVKNCIGYQGTGLWTPDQDSDVTGLVMTVALLQQAMLGMAHHSDLLHVFWVVSTKLNMQILCCAPTLLPYSLQKCLEWYILIISVSATCNIDISWFDFSDLWTAILWYCLFCLLIIFSRFCLY